jgi:hypothetical protein
MPSCDGTTCSYACKPGYIDCSNTAPDLDGCECKTPACCGSSCQTTHSNGVGQSYYDCNPQGTMSVSQAVLACTAYAATQGHPSTYCHSGYTCAGLSGLSFVCYNTGGAGTMNCNTAPYCWGYSGTASSWVMSCTQCTTQQATWN